MATPEFFYQAKFGNIRGLQGFLSRGVDVDSRAVVGGFNAVAPHYSHANEILEGDTALHVALRNRRKECARFLLDNGARRDLKAVQLAQDRGISDVFYVVAPKATAPMYPLEPSSLAEPITTFYREDTDTAQEVDAGAAAQEYAPVQAKAPTAPAKSAFASEAPAAVPHDVDIGVECEGFDRVPSGEEMRRYCVASLVEADREFEDDPEGALRIATWVKDKFEERYGIYWHCACGNKKQDYFRDFCDLKRDTSFQVYVSSWDTTFVLWKSDFTEGPHN